MRREDFVDIIKGWLIITIVFFHITFFDGSILSKMLISLFGNQWNVPMFFILSGFFIEPDKIAQPRFFLRKKFKSLYLPTTLIYIVVVALHNVFVDIGWYPIGGSNLITGDEFTLYNYKDFIRSIIKVLLCGGSGELAMGAMWFVYVLIYAFILLSIISWIIKKITTNKKKQLLIIAVVLFVCAAISNIATEKMGYTINRISTTFSILPLILIGWIINNLIKPSYRNKYLFAISVFIFVYTMLINGRHISLALNRYENIYILLVGCCAAIYICAFIAKRISKTFLGHLLRFVGQKSFYIMALHIIGFFICNSLLEKIGVFASPSSQRGLYTYCLNGDIPIIALYLISGICLPILFAIIIDRILNIKIFK